MNRERVARARYRRVLAAVGALCLGLSGASCGKRGNPMPPLVRLPAAPTELSVLRFDEEVYARLTVPVANIDGARPADIARVDLFAMTTDATPEQLAALAPDDLRELASRIDSVVVRRPLPPPPPAPEGMPAIPLPPMPGVDPGSVVVLRERLEAAVRTPVTLPEEGTPSVVSAPSYPRALLAPLADAGPRRYYFAAAVNARERYGPHSPLVSAPLAPVSSPPSAPKVDVKETAVTIAWTPAADARGAALPAAEGDVLPSRPLLPALPATTYEVYETSAKQEEEGVLTVPVAVTPSPLSATEFTQEKITLGTERCFFVRPVDTIDGVAVRGPASPTTCASFADTFAPSPARDLVAIAVPGVINLIWEASEAADVAGYLVLRGQPGDATLTALFSSSITTLSYRDESVQSGTRYVYAVVAVDKAGNRSAESNRMEETAR